MGSPWDLHGIPMGRSSFCPVQWWHKNGVQISSVHFIIHKIHIWYAYHIYIYTIIYNYNIYIYYQCIYHKRSNIYHFRQRRHVGWPRPHRLSAGWPWRPRRCPGSRPASLADRHVRPEKVKDFFRFWPKKKRVRNWKNWRNLYTIVYYSYIIIWAIVKTLGSRKGHPQIWEGPIAYHTFVQ